MRETRELVVKDLQSRGEEEEKQGKRWGGEEEAILAILSPVSIAYLSGKEE